MQETTRCNRAAAEGGSIDTGKLRPVERMNWSKFGINKDGYTTVSGSISKEGWFKSRVGAGVFWSQNYTGVLSIR